MDLELSGWRVARAFRNAVAVDVKFDGCEEVGLKLEEKYRIIRHGHVIEMDPEMDDDQSVKNCWTPLIGVAVHTAVAEETGELRISFGDGSVLECGPGDMYEPWSYFGPGRMQVLSLPGGQIAVVESE